MPALSAMRAHAAASASLVGRVGALCRVQGPLHRLADDLGYEVLAAVAVTPGAREAERPAHLLLQGKTSGLTTWRRRRSPSMRCRIVQDGPVDDA